MNPHLSFEELQKTVIILSVVGRHPRQSEVARAEMGLANARLKVSIE